MIEVTVKRALELAAARAGDQPALRFEDHVLSFKDFDRAANRLANALTKAGLVAGDRVAAVLPNCPEYVALAFACAKARFTMVATNYRFTAEEYSYQMTDAGVKALIYDERYAASLGSAIAQLPNLVRIVRGHPQPGDMGTLAQVMETGDASAVPRIAKAADLFYLGYTSGTTGKPKGAMVTQNNRALAYHYWALEYGLNNRTHGLHCGPFHHTAPFSFTLAQLFVGGQVTVLPAFDAAAALATIARNRITWSYMVPFMLDRIVELEAAELAKHDLSTLNMLISGGSALTTRTKELLLKLFPKVELHEFYGATEAGVITNLRPRDQQRKIRCVGRSVFDTEVEVRGEDRTPCPVGQVGDIWMRGPTIFSGYYNDPVKTSQVFDGYWCMIGDVGRFDEEGYLYLVDRRKDVIKSGGVNVFPVEIEEVLLTDPAVLDAAVIGVPDDRWGEAVHGVIVVRPGHQITEGQLKERCRAHLAAYKVPKSFEFRNELPRNANGKVLKRVLRDQAVERAQSKGTSVGNE